ncbi:Serine/threonine protein phosphatase PrpC [Limimonas halophila]|uniref:Serine/threonine protein phosphatase PrpC n=1 Tax=Limimonas halophila TaxID=1082479 RepID=A0A1G7R7L1_9PROT|nr:protein phosphatase 2C domain-containing protein [Limimonas halophila]SDG06738.1 Serine/threonine protein phosphatase PrpC [Limimonas halophila]
MSIERVTVHALTHTGGMRAHNEDSLAVGDWVAVNDLERPKTLHPQLPGPVTAIVADGMGGHASGDVASEGATRYLAKRMGQIARPDQAAQLLQEANRHLYEMMETGDGAPGMGTTVVALVLRPDEAILANVGDSRAYRWRAGELVQLSTDDTPGPKLADGRTAAHTSPMLTQSLGGQSGYVEVAAHADTDTPQAGDRYLLASDGLTDLVSPDTIGARLAGLDGAAAVEALFRDAMNEGGKDNISIVLVEVQA